MPRYFWGDDPLPGGVFAPHVLLAMFYGATVNTLIQVFVEPSGPALSADSLLDAYRGVVLVQCLWLYVYCQSIGVGAAGQMSMGELKNPKAQAAAKLVFDRCMQNIMEQAWFFVPGLWLMATFVDYKMAWAHGLFYCWVRSYYVVMYCFYGEFTGMCEFSTCPGYQVVCYFWLNVAFYTHGNSVPAMPWYAWWPFFYFIHYIQIFFFWLFPFAPIAAPLCIAANKKKDEMGEFKDAPLNP